MLIEIKRNGAESLIEKVRSETFILFPTEEAAIVASRKMNRIPHGEIFAVVEHPDDLWAVMHIDDAIGGDFYYEVYE